ncbi:putative hscarg dehydrogenase [Aspergillus cavernicola]|uniref:Hscarg dehydrogenase n=1 Tax=Aspergillus cavernicola TaxID=176166 RepID=A0ABR4HGG2_9EURO
MSKTIVIVGATGTQGSSIAHTFRRYPEWRVRGITRNPLSAASQSLSAKGVEMIKADIDDKQSLIPAFEGANVIFSNTDFFIHLQHALSTDPGREPQEINKYAYRREVEQGVNVAEVAASPSVLKTLDRFIYSSLPDPRKWSNGKYTTVWHCNSKADTIAAIQTRFPELADRMSTLQLGYFTSMWKVFPTMAPLKQADGSFKTIRQVSPSFTFPFVIPERDTGLFVKALVSDLPPKKCLQGVSEYLTWPEWMAIWGRVLGVEARFEQVSKEEMFAGLPGALRQDLEDGYDFIEEFGFTGGDPDVLRPEQLPSLLPLTSMEEYIKGEDWSSVLGIKYSG